MHSEPRTVLDSFSGPLVVQESLDARVIQFVNSCSKHEHTRTPLVPTAGAPCKNGRSCTWLEYHKLKTKQRALAWGRCGEVLSALERHLFPCRDPDGYPGCRATHDLYHPEARSCDLRRASNALWLLSTSFIWVCHNV